VSRCARSRRSADSSAAAPGTSPVAGLPTPVTFCEAFRPDDFPLSFHRLLTVPGLQIRESELDLDAIRTAGILWVTVTGLCEQPSRDATLAATWPDRPDDPRIPMTSTVERRLR
jgi:hypothetical protein